MSREALSVERAWNTVALEERLDLIARSNAEGIVAAVFFLVFMGAVAYGFDQILILFLSIPGSFLVAPIFSSHTWRKGKPELILRYLAARSVTRRYGYAASITDLDVVVLFRGVLRELYHSEEEESLMRQAEDTDFDTANVREKEVWICLMNGGVITLSERAGGAKLEFACPVAPDVVCRKKNKNEDVPDNAVIVTGSGITKGRTVAIWSNSPGALYVFERKLSQLLYEDAQARQRLLESMARKDSRAD